jgi:hypothetical protein
MFKDEHRGKVWEALGQRDLQAFSRLLGRQHLVEAAQRTGVAIRRGPLSAVTLAWLSISSALHRSKNFGDVLVLTLKLLSDMPGWSKSPLGRQCAKRGKKSGRKECKRHNPHGKSLGSVSEEAFVQARKLLPTSFWVNLLMVLGEQFEARHPRSVGWKDFRLLMLDGSQLALPRWKRLADHFGTSKNGKAGRRPQARMLMLALAQSRLPWRYELVPTKEHEQSVAHRLLMGLRRNDLVLMDRGFWNYGLFWQIAQQHAYFAIRLRRGIPLKTLKKLGKDDRLVTWKPSKKSGKKGLVSWEGLPPQITLRVIEYRIRGFRKSAVVTNMLDPQRVSRDEWTRLAHRDERGRILEAGLYHRRWEIETLFHELKIEQGMEGSFRGRSPEAIAYEVAGHVLLYLLTRWLMVEAAAKHGCDPLRLSFKQAQRELNDMRPALLASTPQRIAEVLLPRLLARIAQHRIPFRPGRHFPRIGDKYKLGKYRIRSRVRKSKT